MVIAHNMMAMNAQRQFNIVGTNKKKSMEKLSSGYKINRAADDAAGLTISEKMRSQIRGLSQGVDNCQDGVSLCQIADGALQESHEILQRMNELSIKAANGTNTNADREAIQKEIEQLTEELDRIANSTAYNEKIYPLKGVESVNSGEVSPLTEINGTYTYKGQEYNVKIEEVTVQVKNESGYTYKLNGVDFNDGEIGDIKILRVSDDNPETTIHDLTEVGIGQWEPHNHYPNKMFENITSSFKLDDVDINRFFTDDKGHLKYESIYGRTYTVSLQEYKSTGGHNGIPMKMIGWDSIANNDDIISDSTINYYRAKGKNDVVETKSAQDIWIQAGAKADSGMYLKLCDATADNLGLTNPRIDVSTESGAKSAINRVAKAIEKVSDFRSTFGAQQNRLESTIRNESNIVENTQAAESLIRDTDMASEMVIYTKQNILLQVGESMMSQANQSNQGVLALLQ